MHTYAISLILAGGAEMLLCECDEIHTVTSVIESLLIAPRPNFSEVRILIKPKG